MPFYEVEKVLNKKIVRNNQIKYLIKFVEDARPKWVFDFDCRCDEKIHDYKVSQLAEFLGKSKFFKIKYSR